MARRILERCLWKASPAADAKNDKALLFTGSAVSCGGGVVVGGVVVGGVVVGGVVVGGVVVGGLEGW